MAIFISEKINPRMESGTRKGRGLYLSLSVPCAFFMGGGL